MRSISVRIFASFTLLLLLAVFAASWLTYVLAAREIERQVVDADREMLRGVSDSVDLSLQNMAKDLYTLALSDEIKAYLRSRPFEGLYTPAQLDAFYRAMRKLDTTSGVSRYPRRIRLYVDTHGAMIGGNERVAMEKGYVERFQTDRWLLTDAQAVREAKRVWYVHRILSPIRGQYAALIIEIDAAEFSHLWNMSDAYRLYLLDANGRFISPAPERPSPLLERAVGAPEDTFFIDKGMTATVYTGSNGWRYVKMVPLGEAMRGLRQVRNGMLGIIGALAILLGLLAYRNSTRIAKPLHAIAAELGLLRRGERTDEVREIKAFVDTMREQHRQLSARLLEYSQRFDSERALRMLRTPAPTKGQIHDFLSGIRGVKAQFCALILLIDDMRGFESSHAFEERELCKLALIQLLCHTFAEPMGCAGCKLTDAQIGFIINGAELREEALEAECRALIAEIRARFGISVSFGVGSVVNAPSQVYASCAKARKALARRFFTGYGCAHARAEELPQVVYPPISARHLANVIGAREPVTDAMLLTPLLDALRAGAVEPQLLHAWVSSLLLRLDGALRELHCHLYARGVDQNALLERVLGVETQQQLISLIGETLHEMTLPFQKERKELHPQIREVLVYIDAHLSEDFSQADAAAAVGLNPSYFSTLFKQEMNEPFLQYIQRQRIDLAKQMIAKEDGTLDMIGRSVGFLNAHTFIRTFKKLEGITPGQYKANLGARDG